MIDYGASSLAIEIQQLGSPVAGTFGQWSADVVFDPEAPDAARIAATVQIGSLALSDVSDRASSAEFLNAETYSEATFVSENVVPVGDGYEARGTLTLAGIAQPFALPFTFEQVDKQATVSAQATIERLDHNVGAGFSDDATVGRSGSRNAIDPRLASE